MHDHSSTPGRDPLDDFLAADFAQPAPAPLRQTLLEQTTRLLRRRRRWRRLAVATVMAACYAAGMLTMWLAFPRASVSDQPVIVQRQHDPVEEPKPPAPNVAIQPDEEKALTALDMEWKALDSPEKCPELFRKAGDRYVEESDIPSALRCYRSALEMGSEKDWAISANDNWLLMALKEAKLKEKSNVPSNG